MSFILDDKSHSTAKEGLSTLNGHFFRPFGSIPLFPETSVEVMVMGCGQGCGRPKRLSTCDTTRTLPGEAGATGACLPDTASETAARKIPFLHLRPVLPRPFTKYRRLSPPLSRPFHTLNAQPYYSLHMSRKVKHR